MCNGTAQWRQLVAKHARVTHHGMLGRTTMSTQAEDDGVKTTLSASCHCTQGTKKMYKKPLFRGNSTADPDDIRSPHFDDCAVPWCGGLGGPKTRRTSS